VSDRPLGRQGDELAYQPALDGLRGVAVLAVLLYHGGVSWAGGGFLGVEAFFVLSGFLITSLLLAEWRAEGRIRLGNFWARRARRLLPALFCVIVVTAVYEAHAGAGAAVPDFGADALSTLFYVGNWHQIWVGSGYFQQAALVSPLQHTWSLAIEEQFYLVWPLLVVGLLAWGRRMRRGRPLLFVCVAGAVASAAEMAVLYGFGSGSGSAAAVTRVYYGTDTRAQGLLIGGALAVLLASRAGVGEALRARPRLVGLVGVFGAVLVGTGFALARGDSAWLFRGGFLAFDVGVVAVIVSAVSGLSSGASFVVSPVRWLLALRPLRGVGQISYGLYLWHFPLYLWLDQQTTGVSGAALLWLRLGVVFVVSLASFFVVEQPVRRRRLRGVPLRVAAPTALAGVLVAVGGAWDAGAVAVTASSAPPPRPHLSSSGVSYSSPGHCSVSDPAAPAGIPAPPAAVLRVCPPLRVLVVGDSIGLTLGIQLSLRASAFGVDLWDQARSGCGYVVSGEVVTSTGPVPPRGLCQSIESEWRLEERAFHAQVVVVEMGYWDLSNWVQSGDTVHIGQPGFDGQLRRGMDRVVRGLEAKGVQIVFLSVPLVNPPALPDGSPQPQASVARNRLVNSLLAALPRQFPGVAHYFDIGRYVTPGGRYSTAVDGHVCRDSDGVHFAGSGPGWDFYQTYCGASVQRALLPWLRRLVFGHGG
jgi:peptidoglycan/LPS O-acetylase OafA/YrhL